jgi:oligopeptide transport system substrate-binding protein
MTLGIRKPGWAWSGRVLWVTALTGLAVCQLAAESVYYGETGRIRGFDPARVMDVPSVLAISKVYEGLLQYAYLERPYRVEPLLAEAMPTVSSNALEYTFRIRQGIRFQDDPCFTKTAGQGRELCAADFIYSLKRIADLKVGSSGYWTFRGYIAGLDEFRAASAEKPADYAGAVAGLTALDTHTLRITLTRPFPALPWMLAMNYAYAVPREAVEYYGDDFVNHPVGTGPYVLKEWVQDHKLEFVRNPSWHTSGRNDRYPVTGEVADEGAGRLLSAGQPVPFIDRIVQYVVGDPTTQWLMFLGGRLDMSSISRDNWDAVVTADRGLMGDLSRRGIAMDSAPALDVSYIGINSQDPVLGTNRCLRQAMQSAFDRQQWVRFQNGRVVPAEGPVPPAIRAAEAGANPFPFDLARARELMILAGYPGGRDPRTGRRLELTLELGSGTSDTRETADVLAAFMERIGIVIRPSMNNWPTLLKKIEQKRAQMFLLSWLADYPDPENFLQLFYGPNETPGANRTNYRNARFDEIYEKAARLPDGPGRRALYASMERIVMEDCPWLFLHHSMQFSLRQPWVRNYKPHDFPYGMMKYYSIDDRE